MRQVYLPLTKVGSRATELSSLHVKDFIPGMHESGGHLQRRRNHVRSFGMFIYRGNKILHFEQLEPHF